MTRTIPLATGAALLAVGVALAATGTAALPEGPVRILAFLSAGLAAAGLGLVDLVGRSASDPDAGTLPVPGERGGVRTPGDLLDERLDDLGDGDRRERDALRSRVEAAAVDVLVRRAGLDREAARGRLESGAWTDDDPAAALFAPERASLGTRVRALVAGDSAFARRVGRATAELVRLDEPGGGFDGSGSTDARGDTAGRDRGSDGEDGAAADADASSASSGRGRSVRTDGGASDTVEHVRDRRTNRWVGAAGAALVAAAAGMVARSPGLLLLGGLGAAVVAYARVAGPPPATLTLQREFDPAAPEAGEPVTVRTTVRNVGDRTLPDLRLVDGVPDGMRVVDGPARLGAALRPGAAASVTYRVVVGHGTHVFEPAEVALHDVAGVVGRRVRVRAETDAVIAERTTGDASVPVRPRESQLAGTTVAEGGGDGVEFHGVREYRPGDPMRRVDWRRLARTGELSTITFRRTRSERVVLVVDTRRSAAVAPPGTRGTALDRAATAAASLVDGLVADGHRVGLAALGPRACWIPPGGGREHRRRLHGALADHEAFVAGGGAVADVEGLLARLPRAAHVVFLSPLADDRGGEVTTRLRAHGHAVTVVSPDPTATDTAGRRLARLERRSRLLALRDAGVAVYDWPPGRPVETLAAGGSR